MERYWCMPLKVVTLLRMAFTAQDIESHPLFPAVLTLADLAHEVLQGVSLLDQRRMAYALDSTRLICFREFETSKRELDLFMVDALTTFRQQLRDAAILSEKDLAGNAAPHQDCDQPGQLDKSIADGLNRGHALPATAVDVLKGWLARHSKYPYPDSDEKKRLAQETGLTLLQVNYWFTNARRRYLPRMSGSGKRTCLTDASDDINSWYMKGT